MAHSKEYQKEYRRKNKDKINTQARERYKKDPTKSAGHSKKYRAENKEKVSAQQKSHRCENPEKIAKTKKNYRVNNKEKVKELDRAYSLKYLYDISPEDYNRMFEAQEGKCLICGTHQNDLKKKLFVDHCHHTNKVRGLLCAECNLGLGKFKDDLYLVTKAMEYLQDAA